MDKKMLDDSTSAPTIAETGHATTVVAKDSFDTAESQHEHLHTIAQDSSPELRSHKGLRPLYFAYGSNLSYTQMWQRCRHDPETSAKPIAIARLDKWRWFICNRGYANVVPPEELRVGRQEADGENVPVSGKEDSIYGILYHMTTADEFLLDGYEGIDHAAPDAPLKGKVSRKVRPKEQGLGAYNKWYVDAAITKWIDEEERKRRHSADSGFGDGEEVQTVLLYVDEERVRVGPPKREYIGRMDRGIRESEMLGFPKGWADDVMKKFLH